MPSESDVCVGTCEVPASLGCPGLLHEDHLMQDFQGSDTLGRFFAGVLQKASSA